MSHVDGVQTLPLFAMRAFPLLMQQILKKRLRHKGRGQSDREEVCPQHKDNRLRTIVL